MHPSIETADSVRLALFYQMIFQHKRWWIFVIAISICASQNPSKASLWRSNERNVMNSIFILFHFISCLLILTVAKLYVINRTPFRQRYYLCTYLQFRFAYFVDCFPKASFRYRFGIRNFNFCHRRLFQCLRFVCFFTCLFSGNTAYFVSLYEIVIVFSHCSLCWTLLKVLWFVY